MAARVRKLLLLAPLDLQPDWQGLVSILSRLATPCQLPESLDDLLWAAYPWNESKPWRSAGVMPPIEFSESQDSTVPHPHPQS